MGRHTRSALRHPDFRSWDARAHQQRRTEPVRRGMHCTMQGPSETFGVTLSQLGSQSVLLQCRRASSSFASTSHRSACSAYSSSYGEPLNTSQAHAVALPWTSEQGATWQESVSYAPAADAGAASAPARHLDTAQDLVPAKPLKINRDLLLYRAKLARQHAFRLHSLAERLECYRQAEDALRRCVELDPVDARAYVALGKLLLLQKRHDEARKTYEDGIAVTGGQNEFLWQAWATLEASAGQSSQARKYFKAAVLVNPQHAASWHAWGMLEKREGNLVAAKDLWVKGIKKTQSRPNSYLYQSVAVLAGEMGFLEEARAWFRKGTSMVTGARSHALWHAWAQLEERGGEPRVVRFLYKKGLEASPGSRYIHLAWAIYEKLEGKIDNARKLLKRGHAMNPKDAPILQAWAVLEAETGDLAAARRLFQRSVDADPQHTHAWHAWAMLELRQGDTKRARRLFQSAVWSNPAPPDACKVWQAWSVLEYTVGNFALARNMCNCAVKADPSSDRAWDSWIYQEEQLGNESRVLLLRKARAAGQADVKLPASFSLPSDASEEGGIVDSVMSTVKEWLRKFDGKRSAVRRRPPAYLAPPGEADAAFLEQAAEGAPPMRQMMALDSDSLELPDLPAQFGAGGPAAVAGGRA